MHARSSLVSRAFFACSVKSDKSLGRPGYEAMHIARSKGGGGNFRVCEVTSGTF